MKTQAIECDSPKQDVWELIQTLVAGQASANEILELYYWSREPGVLDLMRNLICLSDDNRKRLAAYLNAADCAALSVEIDERGTITLSAPEVRAENSARGRRRA